MIGVMDGFDHERMDVYQRALEFVRVSSALHRSLVPGHGGLADQLDRAAVSIALNIAEGAGEFARREKARFYRIARRSATECAAVLDIVQTLGIVDQEIVRRGKVQLLEIVGSLIGLGKRMEKEG
jgi:four helix bundle protein